VDCDEPVLGSGIFSGCWAAACGSEANSGISVDPLGLWRQVWFHTVTVVADKKTWKASQGAAVRPPTPGAYSATSGATIDMLIAAAKSTPSMFGVGELKRTLNIGFLCNLLEHEKAERPTISHLPIGRRYTI
jgi:hypothetical protein